MNIRDVMTPNPRTVSPQDSIQNAARIMRDEDTGVVPVVDNGKPVGVITDRDIVVRAVAEGGQLNRPVRDIVTNELVAATPDMSVTRSHRAHEHASGAATAGGRKQPSRRHRVYWRYCGEGRQGQSRR